MTDPEFVDLTKGPFRGRPPLRPGRPVPASKIAAAKAIAETPAAAPDDDMPASAPEPFDATALPPERKKEVLRAMVDLNQQARSSGRSNVQTTAAPVVDLSRPAAGPVSQPATETATSETGAVATGTAGTGPFQHTNCPHCGWDLGVKVEAAEEDDKLDFLQAAAGMLRYHKTYELLGGRAKVMFRSLTAAESDLCVRQAAADGERGLFNDNLTFLTTISDYRFCLSLARYEVAGKPPLEVPALDGYKTAPTEGKDTPIKQIAEHVLSEVISQESTRRMLGLAFQRFERLRGHLEANAGNPNFWPPVVGRP